VARALLQDSLAGRGVETRLDKPSRSVKVGDGLVFAVGGRLIAVAVEALGERRGPAPEARGLYSPLQIT
jgi:ribosome-associated heat shock protein Hsp15